MLRTKIVTQANIRKIDLKTLELSKDFKTVTFTKCLTDAELISEINKKSFKQKNGFETTDPLRPEEITRVKGVYEIDDEKFYEIAELTEEYEIDENGEKLEEVQTELEIEEVEENE